MATFNGPGSSGYWGDWGNLSPQGARPGMGLPGDRYRQWTGQQPLDPALGVRPPQQPGQPTNALQPYGSQPYGAQPTGPSTPTLASTTKSPPFQTAIMSALSQLQNNPYNPQNNPNILRDNTKNPAIQHAVQNLTNNLDTYTNPRDFTKSGQFQSEINQGYSQADADKSANRQQYGNFLDLFNTQTPSVTQNVNQENQSIGEWYDPNGVQAKLDTLAAARARAVNLSGNRALDRIGKNNALLRMGSGDSSYATQQALDTSASVYADEARQQADLARQNYMGVKQGQEALLGARNRGNDYLTNRQTVPINLLSQLGAGEQSRLAQLGGMDLSNNIYTTPGEQGLQRASLLNAATGIDNANNVYTLDSQQSDQARRLALLSQLSQLNNSNNFYGLQQPYRPNNLGMLNNAPTNYGITTPPRYNSYVPPPAVVGSSVQRTASNDAVNNALVPSAAPANPSPAPNPATYYGAEYSNPYNPWASPAPNPNYTPNIDPRLLATSIPWF